MLDMENRFPTVTVPKAIDAGLRNLKANFWPYMLVIVILGILESMSNGASIWDDDNVYDWNFYGPFSGGLFSVLVGFLIKPVFEYGASLIFLKGERGEEVNVRDLVLGFDSRPLYIDILLTNLMVVMSIFIGFLCLVLPGFYLMCRLSLTPFLVMDKGLAPMQAYQASWALTREHWLIALQLGFLSLLMLVVGLLLFIVGMIPAFAWVRGLFASFYEQVLDATDPQDLLNLDITP